MNYSTIKENFWNLIGFASDAHGGYISSENLLKWCNMGLIDLVAKSRCLETYDTILVTAGVQEYDLPDNCERIERVSFNWETITPTMQLALQQEEVYWDTRRGTPQWYYVDMLNDQIGLFYIPGTSTTYTGLSVPFQPYGRLIAETGFGMVIDTDDGMALPETMFGGALYEITANGLKVYYNARPPAIEEDDDVPELPQWAHPLLVYYMLWKACSAMTPLRDLDKAEIWQSLYVSGLGRLMSRTNSRVPKDWLMKTKDQHFMPRVSRMPDLIDPS